jgi:exopolysaccharide production protein ExoZ
VEGALAADARHLDYIDALRGYAILGVIAVHATVAAPGLEWPLRLIAEQGARGVQLFFLVSALTLMLSWRERGDGLMPFYIRRIFRIGPMFWLAIVFFVAIEASGLSVGDWWSPPAVSWPNILATVTFTHGFHPSSIMSIVPGGWSIADEMTFYLLLPLLVATLRSWVTTVWAFVAAVCLSMLVAALAHYGWLFPGLDRQLVEQFAFVSFPNQFPAFLAGILVFHLLGALPGSAPPNALHAGLGIALAAIIAIPFAAMALQGDLVHTTYLMPILYTLPFALGTWCLAKGGGGFMINRATRYIGKVSYSAYFWHFPVLGLIDHARLFWFGPPVPAWLQFLAIFAAAVTLTVGVSSMTYRLVEAPMVRLGRRLADRTVEKRVAVVGLPRNPACPPAVSARPRS